MPHGVEIDHVGLMALIDCLILPAGMAVEIIYLDRSAGDEVNVHRFEKLEGEGVLTPPDAPVLRLLYRPYVSCNPAHPLEFSTNQ
jgi:ubiquitin thioesterase protein OTUB1